MIAAVKIIIGFFLDLLLGDPGWWMHPVQIIGCAIDQWKKIIFFMIYGRDWRMMITEQDISMGAGRKIKQERRGGLLLAVLIVSGTFGAIYGILLMMAWIHPILSHAVEVFLIYQILATKSLKKETMKVYKKLLDKDLAGARMEISYLVGRDTQNLSESGVAKAAVETIAENTADGVIAPLFFLAIGGAPLGMAYKAINTLDSMVGYRNKECIYIGHASAKLDDAANYIPARLSAFFMVAAAYFCGYNAKNAVHIFKRDRYNHLSPNSAQTESVAAGALQIQLGGAHSYFGQLVVKPTIGDEVRSIEAYDIVRANKMLYASACLSLVVLCFCRAVFF